MWLVDQLAAWQRCVVYWACGGVRITLLSDAANSWCWWGTRDVLPLAADAAGKLGRAAGWLWVAMGRIIRLRW